MSSISSISSNQYILQYLQQLTGSTSTHTAKGTAETSDVSGVNGMTPPPPPPPGGMRGMGGPDSAEMSNPAEFFNTLEELQKSDPEKFQEVVSSIADQLEEATEDEDLSSVSSMLSNLTAKFRDVANGGDISQLKPPEPPANPGMMPPDEQYAQQEQDLQNSMSYGSSITSQNSVQSKLNELFSSIFSSLNNI
ncbi:hypothetical protein hrd7_15120 [Leptolinea sp. HRD-7]|nr:hypothetical protein hrd7_15120 [Leptolinea sp. HRD-7]